MSRHRRLGRWGASALIVLGAALAVRPTIDRLVGEWNQQQLAVAADAAIPRYHSAISAAYDVVVSDYEDAIVSFEVGAVPITADGRRLLPVAHRAFNAVAGIGHLGGESHGEPAAPPVATGGTERHEPPPPAPMPMPPRVFSGAIIRIPKIDLSQAVVAGVDAGHLKDGPGHYPGTALPGETGNVVISGHRTTFTRPFLDLDRLQPGDEIILDTTDGSFRYHVESSIVVSPTEVSLLEATSRPILTLTTCTPKGSADQRLIVVAALDGQPLDVVG